MIFRILLLILLAAGFTADVRADDLRPGYLEIREMTAPNAAVHQYGITWKAPIRPGLAARVVPVFPNDCTATEPVRSIDAAALLARWDIMCRGTLAGRSVRLSGIEDTAADALLRYQSATGITQAARLTPANPTAVIAQKPDRWQVARTYFVIGVDHIVGGFDHLLFVVALVLLLQRGWPVVAAATAFTIAHSITLAGTTLGLFGLPQAPVEAVIALSIIFLAVEIVKAQPGRPRLSERLPWLVAFLFGLLHGFGFAGALREIGLPETDLPMALLTFNLGVEAGQMLIIAATLAVIAGLRRLSSTALRPAVLTSAYAIGSIASFWFIERIWA